MKKWDKERIAQDSEILTEFFTVNKNALPKKIYKYNVEILRGTEKNTLCGKLKYFLKKNVGGMWIWLRNLDTLISDKKLDEKQMESVLSEIKDAVTRNEKYRIFMGLKNIEYSEEIPLDDPLIASYFASDIINDLLNGIKKDRRNKSFFTYYLKSNPNIIIDRVVSCRAWDVTHSAMVSVSVESRIVFRESVYTFIKNRNINPEKLEGLPVRVPGSNHTGTIEEFLGTLNEDGEWRYRLLTFAEREETKETIRNAPDDDFVFGVSFKNSPQTYPYVSSGLYFSPTLDVLSRVFPKWGINIDMREVSNKLKIGPKDRYKFVQRLTHMISKSKAIIGEPVSTTTHRELFYSAPDLQFPPTIEFGKISGISSKVIRYDNKTLWKELKTNKIYSINEKFKDSGVIKTLVVHALNNDKLSLIENSLRDIAYNVKIISNLDMKVQDILQIDDSKTSSLRMNLKTYLNKYKPDIVVGIFSGIPADEDEEDRRYETFKEVALGEGIPSQFIYEDTLSNRYAFRNIALGILGKTGNVPYIIHNPPKYADFIVGIDISRKEKKKGPGSVNVAAIARVYFTDGRLFKYTIKDRKIEGETLEEELLEEIFVDSDFENKRIVIHRDGYFRGNEVEYLNEIADQLNSKFYCVEVIKTNTPRLYRKTNSGIYNPAKGDVLIINPTEAIVSTSDITYTNATIAPIRVRVRSSHSEFDLKKALNSVLNLTVLHYGSLKPPKVPVTIHYADKIANLALKGIKPPHPVGNIPYWL